MFYILWNAGKNKIGLRKDSSFWARQGSPRVNVGLAVRSCCYTENTRDRAQVIRDSPALHVGEWLSLVEHLVRDQGVGGSNPLSPTNHFKQLSRTSGSSPTAV